MTRLRLGGRLIRHINTSSGHERSTIQVLQDGPPEGRRLELFRGTLDMLILQTVQWGSQLCHGIGQAIRAQSRDLLKVETGSLHPACTDC